MNRVRFLFALLNILTLTAFAQASGAPLEKTVESDSTALSLAELGAKAGAQYHGNGLSITPTADGALLRCVFQKMEGRVTEEGLWLTSTVDNDARSADFSPLPERDDITAAKREDHAPGLDRFRVIARAIGRGQGDPQWLAATGTVQLESGVARFLRPGLTEEYSVSTDGVRQDFVVARRPGGAGELRLELDLAGAQVEAATDGARLMLEHSRRRLAYNKLHVEDAQGRTLAARLEVRTPSTLAVWVDDTAAVYPVRIDPTFTDENWSALGSGIGGSVLALTVDPLGNLYAATGSVVSKWNGSTWSSLGSFGSQVVRALAVDALGNLYAGADVTSNTGRVAKWNGSTWSFLGSGVTAGMPGNVVTALAVDGAGTVYVGGSFLNAGGTNGVQTVVNCVAKWNGSGWVGLGSGMGGLVRSLAVDGGGNVYAGNGLRVFKWNGSTWSALGSGMDSTVTAVAVDGVGNVYAGGFFTTAGGVSASRIAKWNGSAWSALGSGMDNTVNALEVDGAGNVYAGGTFTTAGGVSASRIAKWNGSAWSALGSGMDNTVNALVFDGSSKLYAGGTFTSAGGKPAVGVASAEVLLIPTVTWATPAAITYGTALSSVQLNATASVPGTFTYTPAAGTVLNAGTNQTLSALFTPNDSTTYAPVSASTTITVNKATPVITWNNPAAIVYGTALSSVQLSATANVPGTFIYTPAAGTMLNAGRNQTLSVTFTPTDTANYTTASANTTITVTFPDGNWSALSSGLSPGGVTAVVADGAGNLYATTGSVVSKWNGSTWSSLGSFGSQVIRALAVDALGNLYAGANMTPTTGQVAKWNGSAWSFLGSGVTAGLSSIVVTALAVDGAGTVYVGGSFQNAGGPNGVQTAVNHVAKWNGSGWVGLGSGLGGLVRSLAVDGAGNVYAENNNSVFKWNGSTWSFLGSGMNNTVNVVAVDGAGNVYAGGFFSTAGGLFASNVAKWNGSTWSNLNDGTTSIVNALAVDGAGNLYAGGTFTSAGDVSASRIAKWNGNAWSALGSGMDNTVNALAFDGASKLYAGGAFTKAGGKPAVGVASVELRVIPTVTWATPAAITYGTALSSVQLNATASVPGTFTYTPAAGTVPNAGTNQTLSALFTPNDSTTYAPVSASTKITVQTVALTVTAANASRTYGSANPVFTGTMTGLVNSDNITVSYSTAAAAGSSVGTYSIVPALQDPNSRSSNYSVTFNNGMLTVDPAALSVTAANASRIYGLANPIFTGTLTGVVDGDNITASYSTSATSASNTGSYPISAALVDPDGKLGNYTVISQNGTLAITRAPLAAKAGNFSKVYGSANPALTISYSGFVNGDTASVIDAPPGAATAATAASTVGTYPIILSGGGDNNYALTLVDGTLTVTPATLLVAAENKTKLYGAALPAFTATYTGFVNGDTAADLDVPVQFSTTAEASSPVGAYPITASGAADANYAIVFQNGTLNVTTAALTITAENKAKTYGAALPALTATYSGFVNGDTAASLDTSASLSTSATVSSSVGTYPITVSGAADANYAISFVNGTLTIDPAALTVTADNAARSYGADNPIFTGTITGIQNSDNVTATYTTTATAVSSVGDYPITATFVDPDGKLANYTMTAVNGTLSIAPAPLSVTAGNASRLYGSANPEFTGEIVGLQNGDAITATYSTTATPASNVGSYPITLALVDSDGKLGNYTVTSQNGMLTVTQAPLTAKADNLSKVYGLANPVLTFSYSGFVNGDTAGVIDVPPSADTTATAASGAGTYPITLSGGSDNNYALTLVSGTLTVTPATLLVAAENKTKLYGAALPVFTATYTGFVNGDTAADLDVPVQFSTTAEASSPVGTYPITVRGGADSNYALVFQDGTLKVTTTALTITAENKTNVYGAALPTLTATYSGFVNGDTAASLDTPASLSTSATASSGVGTYPITASGAADANYAISFVNGTLTIDPAALTVAADNATRSYGAENPTFTGTITGVQNSDNVTATYATSATAASSVGDYPITATLVDPDGKLTNYNVTSADGTLSITPAPLSVTAANASRLYGSANPEFTGEIVGLKNGDAITATYSTTATVASNVGGYPITPTLVDLDGKLGNYTATSQNGTLTVTQAPLTAKADSLSKVYGSANPALTFSYSGFVNGDTASVIDVSPSAATPATAGSAVGTYPITLSGGSDNNYALTLVDGTLTVTPATLLIAADSKTKLYGAALPVLTATYAGFVNGDTAASLETPVSLSTSATVSSRVGTYPITASGAVDANYAIVFQNGTLNVTTAALTITAENKTNVYGAALPTLTATYTGFVNGDTSAGLDTPVSLSTSVTASSSVGTYPITASGAASVNYAINFVNGTLTIDPAALAVTADNALRSYGADNLTFTGTITGVQNSDNITASYSTTATTASNVGNYPITPSLVDPDGKLGNYMVTSQNGTLTVTQAPLIAKADSLSKVYGSANPALTFSYSGFVNGDTASVIDVPPSVVTSVTAASAVGTYPVTLSGGSDNNYALTLVDGTLTVTPATLLITADNKTKLYGATLPVFTATYAGFVNGDTAASLDIPVSLSTSATVVSSVGTYPITASGAADANYAISFVAGTLTVTKAPLTATANNAERNFGEANPPLTGTLAGVVNNDKITATYSTTATPTSPPGSYPIVPSLFDLEGKLGNYAVTLNNGTLTVKNAALLVNAGPDQESVAGDEVTFAGSFTPFGSTATVEWDFGDGTPKVTGILTPKHIYAGHGTYTVTLKVTANGTGSDTLTVTVTSAYGSDWEAWNGLAPFAKESKRIEKAVKDLATSLQAKYWMDEMHLNPKGGRHAFVLLRQATDMLEKELKPALKRPSDGRDAKDDEDDDEFKKIFDDPKGDSLSVAAIAAIREALGDTTLASRLISETLYLENEGLMALDPNRQKHVDAALARAKNYLEQGNALAGSGDFGTAVRRYLRSWDNTDDAIDTAGQSQPAKELVKAVATIEESLDEKYWLDDSHLVPATGTKAFNLMQSAANDLENVVNDAQKGKVIASVGQAAQAELTPLTERARVVSDTLYLDNQSLKAVKTSNQKQVDSELAKAKEDLDKGTASQAKGDYDKAVDSFASSWEHTANAIDRAAKK